MFTGLIQDVARLTGKTLRGAEAELEIATKLEAFEVGESIAVMGACLTVTGFGPGTFTAFASEETLSRTGLDVLPVGSFVNVERALRVGDAIGGHLVTGHVDARVTVKARTPVGEATRFSVALPDAPLAGQVAPKGSVALDGVSLTVNEVGPTSFELMIIPLTLESTTLGRARPGDALNIETDVLAKYVARSLGRGNKEPEGGVDMELLMRSGFVR